MVDIHKIFMSSYLHGDSLLRQQLRCTLEELCVVDSEATEDRKSLEQTTQMLVNL